jgi:N-formylglutamate amidohydrolase
VTTVPFKLVRPQNIPAPLIAHVPHASTVVPAREREQIVLDDASLQRELVRLTDWHADQLFSWVLELGGLMFVNTFSRLVVDTERFANDEDEPMAAVGQGVVYTKTTDGDLLARISPGERARRIREYYEPYHEALTAVVASTLERFGTAVILDCHSFPSVPLPSEPDQSPGRPDICIGTDPLHTPAALAQALESAFRAEGLTVARDRPFAGTLVPLAFLGVESGVRSVMIEVRRGLYCDESTGERSAAFDATRGAVERAVRARLGTVLSDG